MKHRFRPVFSCRSPKLRSFRFCLFCVTLHELSCLTTMPTKILQFAFMRPRLMCRRIRENSELQLQAGPAATKQLTSSRAEYKRIRIARAARHDGQGFDDLAARPVDQTRHTGPFSRKPTSVIAVVEYRSSPVSPCTNSKRGSVVAGASG